MLSIIVAIARNGVIGADGKIPWRIPEDMARFKALTMGKTVVMGRRTWESLPEKVRPLPGRTNVVVTRNAAYALPDGVERAASVADAVAAHAGEEEVMVIGGVGIYAEALPSADRLYVTHVDREPAGDARLDIPYGDFIKTAEEPHDGFAYATYDRKK